MEKAFPILNRYMLRLMPTIRNYAFLTINRIAKLLKIENNFIDIRYDYVEK